MKTSRLLAGAMITCLFLQTALADGEIGFVETFALAPDRDAVLVQLVPGTEEFYFFHGLHHQVRGEKDKLAALLDAWARRFPESDRRRVIENREALLAYESDPTRTLNHLKERLGLEFNHIQEVPDRKPDLPSTLDPARITRGIYLGRVLSAPDLAGLSKDHFETLVRNDVKLSAAQRRRVLSQLTRPDVPGLVALIAEDLKTPESRGFGEFPIHGLLLPDQLDALLKAVPAVGSQQKFVQARLRKLAPGADVDAEWDPVEREAWLGRLWAVAQPLPPAFNSLKAHILHARLRFDHSRGVHDRARFIEYLRLPRPMPYVNPRLLEQAGGRNQTVDLNARFDQLPLPPISSDQSLVRELFLHFAVEEAAWEPWTEWLRDTWVKPLFAEAKITAGVGNPEQWASLLSPAAYQALRERVDIDFAPTNPAFLPVEAPVSIDVLIKNTPKLLVRIYEVNTLGFHLSQAREVNTDLQLDGLVANAEQNHEGDVSPFKRVKRTFTFPELRARRGVWVIEFIGGGKSSRAVLRKGRYSLVQQIGPAGDLLTVLDEQRRVVTNAVAWLDGRQFTANPSDGRIRVPFTAQAQEKSVVLADPDGGFASLASFEHHGEMYRLNAQFHIEREQLLAGRQATLAVRLNVLLGDAQLSPALLEDAVLTLTTTTLDGVKTTSEVRPPPFTADKVFTHSFRVPDRLASVTASLTARVPMLSLGGEKHTLTAENHWQLNGIDRTDSTSDAFLSRFNDTHVFEWLGKNGEPIADRQVVFNFFRRGFSITEEVALRTDALGRIHLGALEDINLVQAATGHGPDRTWNLTDHDRTWASTLHAVTGETVRVPWMDAIEPGTLSLLETRAGTFVADHTASVKSVGGYLEIKDLAAGDYSLQLRGNTVRVITLRITTGSSASTWLVGTHRALEVREGIPLAIESAVIDADGITVQLRSWNAFTRVHVVATRFLPDRSLFIGLGRFERFDPGTLLWARTPNLYSAGRNIGDEYRYILDRRFAQRYPGNLLPRPGLLLNPWERKATAQTTSEARTGLPPASMATGRGVLSGEADRMNASISPASFMASVERNLDFLAVEAPALFNLVPDAEGRVKVPVASLGDRQHFQIYAEDPFQAVWASITAKERPTRFKDLRLVRNLDPDKPATEVREAQVLTTGTTLTVTDTTSGALETYDTLASVHALFTTLSGNADLARFAWILQWPTLTAAEKRARYSEFACHELNYFLSRKDPEFFTQIIRPYLANKKDRTFLDDYLLELDLARYLEPWAYARLNLFERALLGRRLPGEATRTARHLRELWELLPPQPEEDERLFETALNGRGLEGAGGGAAFREAGAPPPEPADSPALESLQMDAGLEVKSKVSATSRLARRADVSRFAAAGMAGAMAGSAVTGEAQLAQFFAMDASQMREERGLGRAQAYYRSAGPTKEWAENNYYRLTPAEQDADRVGINAFWRDFAAWDGTAPFLSVHFTEAHSNLTEMLLALAVLDLPFTAGQHAIVTADAQFRLTAASPVLVFRKQVRAAEPAAESDPALLVSESFYRNGDRYRQEGNERFDRFVTGEFLSGVVYGAHLVVGNPGSSVAKLDLLTQIPKGALPVLGSRFTQSRFLRLEPYTTHQLEYHFYFPQPSTNGVAFPHFPAQAAVAGRAAGTARPQSFLVVRQLSTVDVASWDHVSQMGTDAEVFAFLEQNNLARLDLERIAWRARASVDFFRRLVRFLGEHHVWSEPVYRYAVFHNETAPLREWLRHREDFLDQCGDWLDSSLIRVDPLERNRFEHLEYSPLINPRIHPLGSPRRIANDSQRAQYQRLLSIIAHRPAPTPADQLAVTYHLFLQDRIGEALARLDSVSPDSVHTRLQLDYLRCYAAFYQEKPGDARAIASRHADHPVDRWRTLFAEVIAQSDEIEGRPVTRPGDVPDRERQQAELAAAEASFDFQVENRSVRITWRNLSQVTLNHYLMDPEFLFSSTPFVTRDADRFGIIKPTQSTVITLPPGQDSIEIPIPDSLAQANVLVEVVGAGRRKTRTHHSNRFNVALSENYGRLEVRDPVAGKPVPKSYVKVYARVTGGQVRFLKDGYTDLRGRFDYMTLNDDPQSPVKPMPVAGQTGLDAQQLQPGEFNQIEKLAILVLSDTHGATVREVDPPQR